MAKKKKVEKHIHRKEPELKKAGGPGWHIPSILIITFLVYIPALTAGFVNWDDPDYVGGNNILIRDLSRLPELLTTSVQGNHHPLTMLSLAINYTISGDQAWSYHLFNLIFHLINCILLYRLVIVLTRNNFLVAFVTSLLFGIHPLHVESVAWISERKDVLFTLFFLAGHISYTRFIDQKDKKQFWLTVLFLVLSLLSKPAAVIFPVSLFCIDLYRNRKISFKLITEKIPFFILALAMGIITLTAQKDVGATGEEYFGLAKNILFGFYGLLMYFVKMVIPYSQSAFYPFPPLNEKLPIVYFLAPLFTLALLFVAYLCRKKYKFVVFGISFYIINLLLVLQVFSVGSAVMAERYTYVPYIGFFFIAGFLLDMYVKKNYTKAYLIVAPFALLYASLAFLQARTWKDGATLWDSVIKNQPSSRAYSARATLFRIDANKLRDSSTTLSAGGRNDEANSTLQQANENFSKAINYYSQAIRLNAIDHESHNNRANIYMDLNKFDSAFYDYKQALVIKPDYYVSLDNIGGYYARKGMYDSALVYFNKTLELKPDYKPTYSNRGLVFMSLKRYDDAIRDWQRFLSYEPDAADIVNTIGLCYRMKGQYQDALKYINNAIQMSPQAPFFLNRSYTYFGLNNIENARKDAMVAKQNGVSIDANYLVQLGVQ